MFRNFIRFLMLGLGITILIAVVNEDLSIWMTVLAAIFLEIYTIWEQ